MKIKVVTDSTSDLPKEVCRDLDIAVIPLNVHFGDTVFQDGVDLTNDEFYRKLESSPAFPQTSTKPPGTFAETYGRLAEEADAILSIHVSDRLSGTLNAARLGSLEARVPVELIDSQSASMGLGLLTILAARMARDGASMEDIKSRLDRAIPMTVAYGLFDTLQYLQKGGRIGRAQALIGS
ncbi:MAG: DegV family protein, partial [Chloroflexi bacterium]|nr:DegV family protein [Chloroflexota bacterium]